MNYVKQTGYRYSIVPPFSTDHHLHIEERIYFCHRIPAAVGEIYIHNSSPVLISSVTDRGFKHINA